MSLLVNQNITQAGLNPPTYAAAANGDTVNVTPRGFLHVKNGGGGSVTLTIPKRVAVYNAPGFGDIPVTDIVVVIGAAGEAMIEIPPESHGLGGATLNYSGVSSVTHAYFDLPKV